jgi:3-hydroxyacyl-[acyl-carrier-protein] dehydratase
MESLDINEIFKYLPHRYPFLLVDRVLEVKPGKSITAIKNVTHNEPFFTGHFPGRPIMPGVLILEAMAQASGILIFKTSDTLPGKDNWFFLAGIDNARFKRIVEPGDQLHMQIEILRARRDVWKFQATATVAGELACSAEIMNIRETV